MDLTPQTPRHPSNGYQIAQVGSQLHKSALSSHKSHENHSRKTSQSARSPAFSPTTPSRNRSPSTPQQTPSSARRRSLRLEMRRSPAVKNLDLRLSLCDESIENAESANVNEESIQGANTSFAVDTVMADIAEEEVTTRDQKKRRRSLRLQKQPPVASPLAAVAVPSKKKRRQSAYLGKVATKVKSDGDLSNAVLKTACAQVVKTGAQDVKSHVTQDSCNMSDSKFPAKSSTSHVPSTMSKVDPPVINLTDEAREELVKALEQIAHDVLNGLLEAQVSSCVEASSDDGSSNVNEITDCASDELNDSLNDSMDSDKLNDSMNSVKLNESISSLNESMDSEKENAALLRNRRRDTFDLSRKRGLCAAPLVEERASFEDDEQFENDDVKPACVEDTSCFKSSFNGVKNAGLKIDCLPPQDKPADGKEMMQMNMYVTPKNGSVAPELYGEISPQLKARMEGLTSASVETRMKELFAEFKVYNYPCVSARIFSAMSLLYNDNDHFQPLLPLLTSLVNAEIISLENRHDNNVYFINKRVCFSGYDYSSTMPAVDSIADSHLDLVFSIEALKRVLMQAKELDSLDSLNVAITSLNDMMCCDNVLEVCSKTLMGYFPSSRFRKAIKHYVNELKDIQCHLTGQDNAIEHIGVRFRLGDFIGRSIRFHLRKLLNSIPETIVDFFVEGCEERWGRAVDDRSISSILNFSLDKVNQFMLTSPQLFDDHQDLPSFFSKDASQTALSVGIKQNVRVRSSLKNVSDEALADILSDMEEARSFLLGARACKFVWELLCWPGVKRHIQSLGGWGSIESISKVFYELDLYQCSDNCHFILLRDVEELTLMLAKVVERFEDSIDACECAIRKLGRLMISRQKDHSYRTKGTAMYALRMSLEAEKGEKFPVPVANYNGC